MADAIPRPPLAAPIGCERPSWKGVSFCCLPRRRCAWANGAVDPTIHGEVGQVVVRITKSASEAASIMRAGRHRRRCGGLVAVCAAWCLLFASSAASTSQAYAGEIPVPAQSAEPPASPAEAIVPPPAVPANPALPPPANPAFDLRAQSPEQPSIFQRWWFWTAVGAAAAATVVIIVVSSRGNAPPATDLGNQEFQP